MVLKVSFSHQNQALSSSFISFSGGIWVTKHLLRMHQLVLRAKAIAASVMMGGDLKMDLANSKYILSFWS